MRARRRRTGGVHAARDVARTPPGERYKWVALSNTTMAVFMSALDGSIVIIATRILRCTLS